MNKIIDFLSDIFNLRCFDYPYNALPYWLEDFRKFIMVIAAVSFIMFLLML